MQRRSRTLAPLALLAAAALAAAACGGGRDDYVEAQCGRMKSDPELYESCAGIARQAYDALPEDAR